MMRRLLSLLLSAALVHPAAAFDLPDLGDVAASDLSPLTERRIGESIIAEIRWRDPAYLDDAGLWDAEPRDSDRHDLAYEAVVAMQGDRGLSRAVMSSRLRRGA